MMPRSELVLFFKERDYRLGRSLPGDKKLDWRWLENAVRGGFTLNYCKQPRWFILETREGYEAHPANGTCPPISAGDDGLELLCNRIEDMAGVWR